MNTDNELFRQALQRQNERAAGMKLPDDMEQRVMRHIKPQGRNRRWLYPVSIAAVAASIVVLFILYNGKDTPVEHPQVTQQAVVQSIPQPVSQPDVEEKKEEVQEPPKPRKTHKTRTVLKPVKSQEEPVPEEAEPMQEEEYLLRRRTFVPVANVCIGRMLKR